MSGGVLCQGREPHFTCDACFNEGVRVESTNLDTRLKRGGKARQLNHSIDQSHQSQSKININPQLTSITVVGICCVMSGTPVTVDRLRAAAMGVRAGR